MDETEMLAPVFKYIDATAAAHTHATIFTIRALPAAKRRQVLFGLRRRQQRLRRAGDTHTANILRMVERSAARRRR